MTLFQLSVVSASLYCDAGNLHGRLYMMGNFMLIETDGSYHAFPSGHFLRNPMSFDHSGKYETSAGARPWLHRPLIETFQSSNRVSADIAIKSPLRDTTKNAIAINCLDGVFGHAFYKLLNCQIASNAHPDMDVIVIIHPALSWMVPKGVEQWLVDTAFHDQDGWIEELEPFICQQISRFGKLNLWAASMHYDMAQIDFSPFLGMAPFKFEEVDERPVKISIIARDDRFWLRGTISQFLFLVMIRFRLQHILKPYLRRVQHRNYNKLIKEVRRHFEAVEVKVLGLGGRGGMNADADHREAYDSYIQHEEDRCKAYRSSHVSIGILGSHMLLPSYLSAGFISLVPTYKIPNFGEDYVPRQNDPAQRRIFMSRFLSDTLRPKVIAQHIHQMVSGAKSHGIRHDISETDNLVRELPSDLSKKIEGPQD